MTEKQRMEEKVSHLSGINLVKLALWIKAVTREEIEARVLHLSAELIERGLADIDAVEE